MHKKNKKILLSLCFCLQTLTSSYIISKNNIVYIQPGSFGHIFQKHCDNQYKFLRDLKKALKNLGYILKTAPKLNNLKNAASIICFDVPKDQISFLEQYPIEKRIVFLWEPPTTKKYNYKQKYHKYFSKVYTLLDELIDNKKYFKFYCAHSDFNIINETIPFTEKKLITLLTKKKNRIHPLSLTPERKKIIKFFNKIKSDDFHLYGPGWSKKDSKYYKGIAKSRPQCFKKYKFVFCYENAKNLPGYITAHKILFPMIAKSVPIRWSTTNVLGHIPKNCFISYQDFNSYKKLYKYLKNIPEEEYNRYLKNIEAYLNSYQVLLFSSEYFIHTFISSFLPDYNKNIAFTKEQLITLNCVFKSLSEN